MLIYFQNEFLIFALDNSIINVDELKYGSNILNLKNCKNKNYSFVNGNIFNFIKSIESIGEGSILSIADL